jgi:hypothetical protein
MQALAFTSAWDSGDMFALRRYKEGTSFLALCLQLLEADRVSTPLDRRTKTACATALRSTTTAKSWPSTSSTGILATIR